MVSFYKAQALGNDFVIIENPSKIIFSPQLIRQLCNRKYGIGCDQLIIYQLVTPHTFKVKFFNADGSSANACGNGSRALAKLLFQKFDPMDNNLFFHTAGGILKVRKDKNDQFYIEFPPPEFGWKEIPQTVPYLHALPIQEGQISPYYTINVGNPHLVAFFETLETIDINGGAVLEHHPLFPERINVSFAQVINVNRIRLKVWERGSGFTGACGTAACATVVIATREAMTKGDVIVHQEGGDLSINWKKDLSIEMAGPATLTFKGKIDFSLLGYK